MSAKRGRPINPESKRQKKLKSLPHIDSEDLRRLRDAAGTESYEMTKKLADHSQWRRLAQSGITVQYFELLDITDPGLMEPDKLLTLEQALTIPKYKYALEEISRKRNRIQSGRCKGGSAIAKRQKELVKFVKSNFSDVILRMRKNKLSAIRAEVAIRRKMIDEGWTWQGCIDNLVGPSSRTLRGILGSLAKASSL